MKVIQLLLVLFLLVPISSALEVTELEVLEFESHGQPIGPVTTSGQVPGIVVKMVVTGSDFQLLEADLSNLNRNTDLAAQYRNMQVSANFCDKDGDTYTCYFGRNIPGGIRLLLPGADVIIPIAITNTSGDRIEFTEQYVFIIDDTAPELVFIGTDACIEDVCYVSSGDPTTIIMSFQDSKASFNKKVVKFNIDGDPHFAYKCEGMECLGTARITCNSGQRVSLKIIPSETYDDAYNQVSNSLTNNLLCDGQDPVVISEFVESLESDYVRISDTMLVTMNITDDLGPVSGIGDFSEFGGEEEAIGDCQEEGNQWTCTFSSMVLGDGPFTAKAHFKIRDFAGNTINYDIEQEIYGIDENTEPNFWTLKYDYGPGNINKQMVPYVQKKIYLHSSLKSRASGVDLLNLEIDSCEGNGTRYLSNGRGKLFTASSSENPVLVFNIRQAAGGVPDDEKKITFNCTLKLQSSKKTSKGTYYVKTPETEIIEVEVDFINLKRAETLVQEKLTKLDEDNKAFQESISPWIEGIQMGMTFCDTTNAMNAIDGASQLIAPPLIEFTPTRAFGEGLSSSTKRIGGASDKIHSSGAGEICDFLACKLEPYQTGLTGQIGELGEGLGIKIDMGDGQSQNLDLDLLSQSIGYNSYTDMSNADNSFILSVLTACMPSIVYNLQKKQAIDCEYAACLKRDALGGGLPISECDKIRNYNQCRFFVGDIFEIIPVTNLWYNSMDFVKNTISNPVSLVGLALSAACAWIPGTPGAICEFTNTAAKMAEYINVFANFGERAAKYDTQYEICEQSLKPLGYYRNRYYVPENLQDLSLAKVDDDSYQCTGFGCSFETNDGDSYEIIYDTPSTYDEDGTIIHDGDPIYYVNGKKVDFLPGDITDELTTLHDKWMRESPSTLPDSIRENFLEYGESINDANEARQTSNDAQNAYDDYESAFKAWEKMNKREGTNRAYSDEERSQIIENLAVSVDTLNNLNTGSSTVRTDTGIETVRYDNPVTTHTDSDGWTYVKNERGHYTVRDNNGNVMEDTPELPEGTTSRTDQGDPTYDVSAFEAGVGTEEGSTAAAAIENEFEGEGENDGALKELDGEADVAEKESKEKYNKMNKQQLYPGGFGSWRTTAGNIRGFQTMSALMVDWGWETGFMKDWREGTYELFHNSITDREYAKSAICDDGFLGIGDGQLGGSAEFGLINTGQLGTSVGAHIEGERVLIESDEEGDSYYEYYVSGLVAPKNPEDGLKVQVILNPGEYELFNKKTNESDGWKSFDFKEDQMLTLDSGIAYDTVCMKFSGNNLKQQFDYVKGEKDKICNKIVEVK